MSSAATSQIKATLIVAHDSARGIGLNGKLPWRLRQEMKYFAQATSAVPSSATSTSTVSASISKQNAVIMGRTTWTGIPAKFRPLKDRINVVLSSKTRQELDLPDHVLNASSLGAAIQQLSSDPSISKKLHHVFIIGGAQLYESSIRDDPEIASRILLTRITKGDDAWQCDTFFPELDASQWRQCSLQEHRDWLQGVEVPEGEVTEGDVSWRYEMWERRA